MERADRQLDSAFGMGSADLEVRMRSYFRGCHGIIVSATLTLATASVSAQERAPDPRDGASQPGIGRIATGTREIFNRPLHPIIDTVAAGGWVGAGIGFDPRLGENWRFSSKALVTMHRYWQAGFETEYTNGPLGALAYGRARGMSRLSFFGIGSESALIDQTSYTLRDPVLGLVTSLKVLPGVRVGGRLEESWPVVKPGKDPAYPSIEQRFTDQEAPGLFEQPRYGRYGVFVEGVKSPSDGWTWNQGAAFRVNYDIFDDQQLERFDFDRLQIEARQRFAGLRPYHTLTLRGWVSSAKPRAASEVPFFLQHTLGGTSNVRSVDDAPVGGDRTEATLRGYSNHRYRDNHLLLLQAEYRWNVWGPLETTLFFDTGKVTSRRSDLNLSHLQSSYGLSLSLMRGPDAVARTDIGFGGDDGVRVFVYVTGVLR